MLFLVVSLVDCLLALDFCLSRLELIKQTWKRLALLRKMVSNQLMYMIMKEKVGLSRSFNGKQEIEMMGIREGSFGLVQDVGEALTLHIEVDTALRPRA